MPDGWESGGITDITIPGDAGPSDPRVYVGQNDPIALSLSQDAALVFYFGNERAFLITVEQSGDDTFGQLHFLGFDSGPTTLKSYIDFDFDIDNDEGFVYLAQSGRTQNLNTYINGLVNYLGGFGFDADKEGTDVRIYGESMPRGFHASAGSAANQSVTVAAGETLAFATAGEDYYANRAYRVYLQGGVRSTVANGAAQLRLRKTGVGGQDLGEFFRTGTQLANTVYGTHGQHVFTVGATTVNASIALTVQANVNTQEFFATATSPREIVIEDVGAASRYPLAPVLV